MGDQHETEGQETEVLTEAATYKAQAKRLMRDMESLLADRTVPSTLRKEVNDVRAALRKTWKDLGDEAGSEEPEEPEDEGLEDEEGEASDEFKAHFKQAMGMMEDAGLDDIAAEFNSFHDALGRFGSGGSGAKMAPDTGGGGGGGNTLSRTSGAIEDALNDVVQKSQGVYERNLPPPTNDREVLARGNAKAASTQYDFIRRENDKILTGLGNKLTKPQKENLPEHLRPGDYVAVMEGNRVYHGKLDYIRKAAVNDPDLGPARFDFSLTGPKSITTSIYPKAKPGYNSGMDNEIYKLSGIKENAVNTISALMETFGFEPVELSEPFPAEHAARISDPSKFESIRRQNDKFGPGIDVIWGITKDGKTEMQAVRFDKKRFTADEAKAWLKDHDMKAIEFEKAEGDDEVEEAETPPARVKDPEFESKHNRGDDGQFAKNDDDSSSSTGYVEPERKSIDLGATEKKTTTREKRRSRWMSRKLRGTADQIKSALAIRTRRMKDIEKIEDAIPVVAKKQRTPTADEQLVLTGSQAAADEIMMNDVAKEWVERQMVLTGQIMSAAAIAKWKADNIKPSKAATALLDAVTATKEVAEGEDNMNEAEPTFADKVGGLRKLIRSKNKLALGMLKGMMKDLDGDDKDTAQAVYDAIDGDDWAKASELLGDVGKEVKELGQPLIIVFREDKPDIDWDSFEQRLRDAVHYALNGEDVDAGETEAEPAASEDEQAEGEEETTEFNPYHDALGRFGSGGSGAKMAPDTGGGGGGGAGRKPSVYQPDLEQAVYRAQTQKLGDWPSGKSAISPSAAKEREDLGHRVAKDHGGTLVSKEEMNQFPKGFKRGDHILIVGDSPGSISYGKIQRIESGKRITQVKDPKASWKTIDKEVDEYRISYARPVSKPSDLGQKVINQYSPQMAHSLARNPDGSFRSDMAIYRMGVRQTVKEKGEDEPDILFNEDGSTAEALGESAEGVEVLSEGAIPNDDTGPLTLKVKLIEPGFGNKRDGHYYPAATLSRDAHVFKGAKMYETDHKQEDKSTRTWVSTIRDIVGFSDTGAPLAEVVVHDPSFAQRMRNLKAANMIEQMACSILANGNVRRGEIDGQTARIVESITDAQAVDWVTRAGAGGQALAIMSEAQSEPVNETGGTNMADEEQRQEPAQPTEPVQEQAAPPEKLGAECIASILQEAALPEPATKRLGEREYVTEEQLREAIVAEVAYLKEVTGSGKVTGLGESKPVEKKPEERLAEKQAALDTIDARYGIRR